MNEKNFNSDNDLIFKRLTANKPDINPIKLPNINKSLSSLSLNLSTEVKKDLNKEPNLRNNLSKLNLNPKLFKILNSEILKGIKYKKINSTKNQLFGKLANNIANKKMKNYFYYDSNLYNNNDENKNENKNENIEDLLKKTNKRLYFNQKLIIEKIIKKQKNLLLFNHDNSKNHDSLNNNNNFNDKSLSGNNSDRNLSFNNKYENRKIKLDLKNIRYHSPLNSLNSLLKNKIIYKNIIKNYKKNTIEGFENSIISMNPILKYQIIHEYENNLNLAQKINILPYIPKTIDNTQKVNNTNDKLNINILSDSDIEKAENINELNKNSKSYLLNNYFQYPKKNFPESRAQFSFSQEGKEYILFGGFNSNRQSKIWKFNPDNKTWSTIEIIGPSNDNNRSGHTGVLRYRNLYIFGGKLINNLLYRDLAIFSLDSKKWTYPKIESNKTIYLRKNHIACSIGNQMFIYGGINEEEKYLNDVYLLSYKLLKWSTPFINKRVDIPSIAYHSCCLIIPEKIRNNSKFNIYRSEDNLEDANISENIREKGLYIFGGKICDGEKIRFNKDLYLLKICRNPLEWTILITSGIGPCERYGCSMSYYERGNFLVIHGGKNTIALNDTFLLDLFNLNWMKVEYFNKMKKIPERYFHQSIIDNNNLFIFGGANDESFLGSEMLIIELDSNWKCLKKTDEINYIRMIKRRKNIYNNIDYNYNLSFQEIKSYENKEKTKRINEKYKNNEDKEKEENGKKANLKLLISKI